MSHEEFSSAGVQKLWFYRRWFEYRYITSFFMVFWPFQLHFQILFQLWIGLHQKHWEQWNSQQNLISGHLEFWCGKFLLELRNFINPDWSSFGLSFCSELKLCLETSEIMLKWWNLLKVAIHTSARMGGSSSAHRQRRQTWTTGWAYTFNKFLKMQAHES